MDGHVGIDKLSEVWTPRDPRLTGYGHEHGSGTRAIHQFSESIDTAQHRDRISFRMESQMTAP
jgi:hypothetical protein